MTNLVLVIALCVWLGPALTLALSCCDLAASSVSEIIYPLSQAHLGLNCRPSALPTRRCIGLCCYGSGAECELTARGLWWHSTLQSKFNHNRTSLTEKGDKRNEDKYFCVEADCVHTMRKQRLGFQQSVISIFPFILRSYFYFYIF